jgi:hypothetical protein
VVHVTSGAGFGYRPVDMRGAVAGEDGSEAEPIEGDRIG